MHDPRARSPLPGFLDASSRRPLRRLLGLLAAGVLAASPMSLLAAPPDTRPPAAPERVFWSGHSLTDRPIPDHFAAIANSLGHTLEWNRQYIVGSSIRARTRGTDGNWSGYREGMDPDWRPVDVLAELAQPTRVSGPYDALIITEQHDLLETMVWNDPVRHLRHFHDRYIERNPTGSTFFYQSWLDVGDKNDPRPWIAYERSAMPMWECLVTRINTSLEAEGRADRLQFLPVAAAFADLVERTTSSDALPALRQPSIRATMDTIFKDNVHLTPLGSYYAALATYALRYRSSPAGAWAPPGVSPAQAALLQDHAWRFAQQWRATHQPLTLEQCRAAAAGDFGTTFWRYMHDTYTPANETLRQRINRWRLRARSWWQFWREGPDNPFRFDAKTDRAYWFPPAPAASPRGK